MTTTYVEPVGLEPTAVSLKGYYSTIELRFHVVTHDPVSLDHFHLREINTKERVSNPSGIGEEAAGFEPAVAINHFSFQD